MMLVDPFRAGSTPATIAFQGFTASGSAASNILTATACPIGTAVTSRRVFCIVNWTVGGGVAAGLSSATIGGIAATIHVQATHPWASVAGFLAGVAIISAVVPTGTTADVVGTFDAGGTLYNMFVASYSATGVLSATPIDTISDSTTGTSYSGAIDVLRDGVLLTGFSAEYNNTPLVVGGATQDHEEDLANFLRLVAGSLAVTADETNRSITLTGGSTPGTPVFGVACASFR